MLPVIMPSKVKKKYRLMYDGLACWPYLRHNSETLASMGVKYGWFDLLQIYSAHRLMIWMNIVKGTRARITLKGIDLALQRRRAMIDEISL